MPTFDSFKKTYSNNNRYYTQSNLIMNQYIKQVGNIIQIKVDRGIYFIKLIIEIELMKKTKYLIETLNKNQPQQPQDNNSINYTPYLISE